MRPECPGSPCPSAFISFPGPGRGTLSLCDAHRMTLQRTLLALAVFASFACQENPATNGDASRCEIGFEAARSDPALREACFASLAQCDVSVRQDRDAGRILGVLYAPDSARIKKELSRAYGALGYSQADISRLSDATIAGTLETASTALAAISSTDFGFFAQGLPVFILAFERFASRAETYARHWRNLDSLAIPESEIAVGAAQKLEFHGIVPEVRGDTLLLRFDRYGRSMTAVFGAAPAPKLAAAAGLRPEHALVRWEMGNE